MLELVLLIALVILIAVLWGPFKRGVLGALDARAERIRAELDEAQRLHEEAKALLAKYQRQLHEGERLADDIRAQAERERQRLEERLKAEYEAAVKRRTEQATQRIAQEEARAVAEVRARAADLSARATRHLLVKKLSNGEAGAVIQNAIGEVRRKLAP